MEELSSAGTLPVLDLFSYLQGDWELTRTINDLRMNMPGHMSGTTTITRQPDKDKKPTLAYREEGQLSFGDYNEMTFSQVYSEDYIYCRQLLRLKPKTITMLLLQGYIQKMNYIYKPDIQQICDRQSSLKNSSKTTKNNIKAITN